MNCNSMYRAKKKLSANWIHCDGKVYEGFYTCDDMERYKGYARPNINIWCANGMVSDVIYLLIFRIMVALFKLQCRCSCGTVL